MSEATKSRLTSSHLRRLLCKLGLHKWADIYTKYAIVQPNGAPYRIAWDQYCLYCPAERENPIHVR